MRVQWVRLAAYFPCLAVHCATVVAISRFGRMGFSFLARGVLSSRWNIARYFASFSVMPQGVSLFVKKTVKTVYDVWGKKFICAHFLEGQNFIKKKKKNEKMNLENNYFRKIKIFEKCFFPSYRKSISTVNELQAKGVLK